jgi:hypothetical protein
MATTRVWALRREAPSHLRTWRRRGTRQGSSTSRRMAANAPASGAKSGLNCHTTCG